MSAGPCCVGVTRGFGRLTFRRQAVSGCHQTLVGDQRAPICLRLMTPSGGHQTTAAVSLRGGRLLSAAGAPVKPRCTLRVRQGDVFRQPEVSASARRYADFGSNVVRLKENCSPSVNMYVLLISFKWDFGLN